MLALTKKPHTDGMVSLTVVVPAARVEAVTMAIEEAVMSLWKPAPLCRTGYA
jgi:hypothetical protein